MMHSDYLVVGASHAGMAAIEAIRTVDSEGSILVLDREDRAPYSPTILPYVMTGRVSPAGVQLRDEETLVRWSVFLRSGTEVVSVDPGMHRVRLLSGDEVEYGKLLLAMGASPEIPPVPGLERTPFHVLRTMDDAVRLRGVMAEAREAVILGAGLIGLHAAECLHAGGCRVTVVEALPSILPGYFDERAAGLLEEVFTSHGVRLLTGCRATSAESRGMGVRLSLEPGGELEADFLLVAAGVRCNTAFLEGSGIDVDQGIYVDACMRTGLPGVWAAGDTAQAESFFGGDPTVIPNVLNAAEQGRTAGFDMAGDGESTYYRGSLAANTSAFFGHQAFSIGRAASSGDEEAITSEERGAEDVPHYLKLVFRDRCLVGALGINADPDPGILAELIRRREDLGEVRADLIKDPKTVGRALMSRTWG